MLRPQYRGSTDLGRKLWLAGDAQRLELVLHGGHGVQEAAGEAGVSASVLQGRLAPGPDYKLYLSPTFVETEADFKRLKSTMLRVGDIKTFENFAVPLPPGTDLSAHTTVVVWCETFNEFITAARYR